MAAMYPNRHKPRGTSRIIKLTALWLLIGSAVVGVGAAAFTMQSQPPSALTLCERGTEIADSTLILIDTTDALSENHKRRLRTTVETERDRLPRGAKFSVLVINADTADEPIEIVSICNPGRGNDVNPLFATASRTEKQWTEEFAVEIEAGIGKASSNATAEQSRIIGTIYAVLTRPDFDRRIARRRLVVVSDLLEHTEQYSQLRGDFGNNYRQSNLARTAPLDLHGAVVAIDYLQRPAFAEIQGTAHRAFWKGLFMEAGADGVDFVGLSDVPQLDEPSPTETLTPQKAKNKAAAAAPPNKKPTPPRRKTKKAERKKK